MAEIPRRALATVLRAKVGKAVLRDDHAGIDTCVIAHQAYKSKFSIARCISGERLWRRTSIAVSGGAVCTIAVTSSTSPCADTLKCTLEFSTPIEDLELTISVSATPKLEEAPGPRVAPYATDVSGTPFGAFPTAGHTAKR